MCLWYILSDNGTEFKNSFMDQVLQHLGIDRITSALYHPQSNGRLEVFHKYLKPTLKKLCEKDKLGQIHEPGSSQLQDYTQSSNSRNTIFPSIWQRSQSPPTPTSGAYAIFIGDPDSGMLNLETHRLTLAIAKKTLDENRFCSYPEDNGTRQTSLPNRTLHLL